MAPGLFWGIVLIVIGVSVIIKVVFNIHIPMFRIVAAFVLIFLAIRILLGPGHKNFRTYDDSDDIIFNEKDFRDVDPLKKEYNIVFGKANYDLRHMQLPEGNTYRMNFNVVFGGGNLILNDSIPVKIKSDAVFSGVKMPDGSSSVFGTSYYHSPGFNEERPYLYIKIDAVFSGIDIQY